MKYKNFNAYSKAAYNNKADQYNQTPDGRFTEPFKQMLCENMILRENDSVLDVACGNGRLLKMLDETYQINGYGIDISDRMIENARRNCPRMTFKVAGCEDIPFESNFFDAITVSAAYHHFPDIDAFAKEARRVIKQEGYLYIADIYLPSLLRIIVNPFVPLSKEGDVKFYSPNEIVRNFEAHGFKLHKLFRKGHIQIVCMKRNH